MATSMTEGIAIFGSAKIYKPSDDPALSSSYARQDCAINTLLLAKKKKAASFLGVLVGDRIFITLAD